MFAFHIYVRHQPAHGSRRLSVPLAALCALVCAPILARAQELGTPAPATLEPPAVLEQRQPEYPGTAIGTGFHGDVAVNVDIDVVGNVTGVSLVRGVAPSLDRLAMEAASRWRFRPALRTGIAVPSRVQLLFHFEPPAASPPAVTPPGTPSSSGGPPAVALVAAQPSAAATPHTLPSARRN